MATYFAIIGFLMLALGIILTIRRVHAYLGGKSAIGTVIAHEVRTMDDSTAYLPTVEFNDAEGKVHRFTSPAGHGTPRLRIGEFVPVRYLPSNPKIAYISSFLHMWAGSSAFIILGLVALYVAWKIQLA